MKRSMKMLSILLLGTVFFFGDLSAVHAQEEEKDVFTLDEVIVTATKREESIFEVPLTVTAFDSEKIAQLGMVSMDDLNMLAPGLQIGESTEMRDQGWVIRGIGSRLWGENHSDQAVAFYVDGIYTNAPIGIAPGMFDIQRIEVARGPQGTLFGRNSIAGSISWFNKKPTAEWDAEILGEWTDQFSQRYGVAFGGPLGFLDGLRFRVTGHYDKGQGTQKNIGTGPDLGASDNTYHAEQLRYKSDRFDINVRYAKTENAGKPRMQINLASLDREDTLEVWQTTGVYNPHYLWNYEDLGDPFPAVADCDESTLPYATKWEKFEEWLGYGVTVQGVRASDTKYYYYNKCDELRNVVNLDADNSTETTNETISLSFDWHVFDWLSARFVYGKSRVFTVSSREDDNNSRVSGWGERVVAGEMVTWPPAVSPGGQQRLAKYWMIDPWSPGWQIGVSEDSERQIFRLSQDSGAYFDSRYYENPYNLHQQSVEMVFFSDFDGPLNFILGAFYYDNETSYEHDTYNQNVWYQNREEIGWEEFNEDNSPHTWDDGEGNLGIRVGNAGYDGEYGPDTTGTFTDDSGNVSYGWYPFTQDGCEDFFDDITRALDDGVTYICLPFYEAPENRWHEYHWQTQAISDTRGVFGHLGWQISDQWSVAGGLRYTEDYKRKIGDTTWYLTADGIPGASAEGLVPQYRLENETKHLFPITWEKLIWDVAIEYNFAENTMVYGRVATGYRAGGPQSAVEDEVIISPIVEEETLINYEIGVKGSLFDQRLWFTTGAFYSPYDGFQLEQNQPYPAGVPIPVNDQDALLSYIANIDGTEIWGAEMDFTFLFTEQFSLSGSYIYMDSSLGENESVVRGDPNPPREEWYNLLWPDQEYDWFGVEGDVFVVTELQYEGEEFKEGELTRETSLAESIRQNRPCKQASGGASSKRYPCWQKQEAIVPTDKTGNQLAMQPNHKWTLTGSYTIPMPNLSLTSLDLGNLQLLATYSYTGKRHPYIANLPAQEMPGYGELNLRASWWSPTGTWSTTIWVSNALDDINLVSFTPATVGGSNQDSVATLSNPRRVGLTIRYKFGS